MRPVYAALREEVLKALQREPPPAGEPLEFPS